MDVIIYMIRHAQTESNALGKIQGRGESHLTELGRRQVQALSRRLRRIHERAPFKVIYSSPTSRALRTAEALAEELKLPLEVDELLAEMDHGEWDGLSLDELEEREPERWAFWRGTPQLAKFPGGESLLQATDRMRAFLTKLLHTWDLEDSLIVVSHAGVIKLAVLLLLGLSLEKYWFTGLENTSINVLFAHLRSGQLYAHLLKLNDTGHLEEELLCDPHKRLIEYLKRSYT